MVFVGNFHFARARMIISIVFSSKDNSHDFHQREGVSESRSVVSDSLQTPWTAAHQASLHKGFPGQEYWSGLPFLSPIFTRNTF